jgi:hypothetical protein
MGWKIRALAPASTLCYPQAWLFEPFFFRPWTAATATRTAITLLVDDVKLGGGGLMGLDGKKFSLVNGLKPDQQGIGSATVSAGAEERGGDAAADPPPHSVVMGKHP